MLPELCVFDILYRMCRYYVVLTLLLYCCGGAVQTRAVDGDRLSAEADYLKAVAYYDLALEKDIPSDHPLYEETLKKRRNALGEYANDQAGKSDLSGIDLALKMRTVLNTLQKLDPDIDPRQSQKFATTFDSVLQEIGQQALSISLPGKKMERLAYLASLGIENNPAHVMLASFRKDALKQYEQAIPGTGEYLRFLYLVASRHVELSRPMPNAPDVGLALENSGVSGSCANDLSEAVTRTEGPFPIRYRLQGSSCQPSTKRSEKVASYEYTVNVPKTVQRKVQSGQTCVPKKVQSTEHYCAKFKSSGFGCVQHATRLVTTTTGQECTPNFVFKSFVENTTEIRKAERFEKRIEESYSLQFALTFLVGEQEVKRVISVSHSETDAAYQTEHGSKTISLTNASVRRTCLQKAKAAIVEKMADAQEELGNQRFASAQNDNDRALAALLGAQRGNEWMLSRLGFHLGDIRSIKSGERIAQNIPTDFTAMPTIDKSFTPGGKLGLKYADEWKRGTNLYLTEGGDLIIRNESSDIGGLGALSAQYESRGGLADFKLSWWGMIRAEQDSPSDNIGWGLGYKILAGGYRSSTGIVYTLGGHYEQHKDANRVSFRAVTADLAIYYPISQYLSLDAGMELNAIKLFELAEKWGAGSRIDHGSPVWAGASFYLGRHLSLGLHQEARLFSDVGSTTILSLSVRH